MTGIFDAFLSDIVNDCVNGQTGPTDWSATDAAETREAQFRRIMPEDEGLSSLDAEEARAFGEWPVWSRSSAEQPPYRSAIAAAQWAEDHAEDADYDYDSLAEGYYDEADQ